jgi:hypothetical protein
MATQITSATVSGRLPGGLAGAASSVLSADFGNGIPATAQSY